MSSRRRLTHSLTDAFSSGVQRERRGTSVLFEPAEAAQQFRRVPVDRIAPRADSPRRTLDATRLDELADSVRAHGVLQPIRVRPSAPGMYEIVAGERRWLAARQAGLRNIPAVVVVADDDQAFIEALIENVQREDLNAVDRAHALQQLRVNLGLQSWEDVGRLLGVSRQHVHNLLRVTALPEPMQDDVRAGDLTEKHCRALLRLRDTPDAQADLWERIHSEGLSGDSAIAEAKRVYAPRPAGADADSTGGPTPARRPVGRIAAVAEALLEALDDATGAELDAAHTQLTELHSRLGAVLAAAVSDGAAPVAAVTADGVSDTEEWRPVLVPIAHHHAG
jgi:ParB family transcriptional regulator, chromosome partitioning protein